MVTNDVSAEGFDDETKCGRAYSVEALPLILFMAMLKARDCRKSWLESRSTSFKLKIGGSVAAHA
jgi:hypothetical protein